VITADAETYAPRKETTVVTECCFIAQLRVS
jgi:hypothetical protein